MKSHLGRSAQEHAVQAADVTFVENSQIPAFQLIQVLCVGSGCKYPRGVLGVHFGSHRRKCENSLYSQFLNVLHELSTKWILAEWRLCFPNKYQQVVLLIWVFPDKQTISRPPRGLNDSVFHIDVVNVDQVSGFEFGDRSHAEFRKEIDARIDGDVPHPRPHGY